MRRRATSRKQHGFALPAAVAGLSMVALFASLAWYAFSTPRGEARAVPRTGEKIRTTIRDVLTGRLTLENGTPVPVESGPGSPEEPLRIHFVPSSDQAQAETAIGSLIGFLKKRTGYAIRGEGAILPNYGLVVESLAQGRTDIAFLTAASYARARLATHDNGNPEDDALAFLQVVRQGNAKYPGSELAYRAVFLVRNDSPLKTVDDIDETTRIAMGAPTSGASSLLPSAMLNQMGVTPRVTRYLGGYPTIVAAVYQGAVDVGCIWWSPPTQDNPVNDARIQARKTLPDVLERTRILGFTGWIPNEPVVARASVPPEVRHVLGRALQLYVASRTLTEAGRRELEAIGSIAGYIQASDADFEPLMEIIESAFANDPEGWADFRKSRK